MKKTILFSFLGLVFIVGLVALNARSTASNNEKQKSRIIKQIESSSLIPIHADNSQGSELYIQEAGVKEISGDDFRILSGEATEYFNQTTYPEVAILNNSAKTVVSFIFLLEGAADKPEGGRGLFKKNVLIPPGSTFKVTSSEWPMAELVSMKKEGEFTNGFRQPPMDSAKAWIPGRASELKITVGLVEFADGTRWIIPSKATW